MNKLSKQEVWARRIAAWRRSGLSRGVWCAAQGVNVHTLDYWRYRLRDAVKGKAKASDAPSRNTKAVRPHAAGLVPVMVREATAARAEAMVELTLRDGVVVRAPVGVDAVWMAALVRELSPC
jgi:hypothetical protein